MLKSLQLFCLPGLFGIIALLGYVYSRSEKSWLNNLANGILEIVFGGLIALVGYGISTSEFSTGNTDALLGSLTTTGKVITGIGILIALYLISIGLAEIVRTTKRKDQGDESYIKSSIWFWQKNS